MSILEAIILGIVQGVTEFLPVSSSGHLLFAQQLFDIQENSLSFSILLHLGTLIPVLIVFWSDIWKLIVNPFQKLTYVILLGSVPAAIVGLTMDNFIEEVFYGGELLWITFLITAFVLLYSDKVQGNIRDDSKVTYKDAIIVGTTQAFAILPGISRSGSTIASGLYCGLNRETSAKISFLLSIPAVGGAFLLDAVDVAQAGFVLEGVSVQAALAGFLASMLSGYLSIKFMLALIKKAKLKYFSYYLFVLSSAIFITKFII